VSFTFCNTFDACRQRVIATVEKEFPSADPNQTVEVDVIGLSMGGLVGRYCATLPSTAGDKRLRIHTLYTAASPHRGALRAEQWPRLLKMQGDMTPGSDFYRRLEAAEREVSYELVPYVRLGDTTDGPQYAAPTGRTPWWVPNRPGDFAHVGTMGDPRIMSDVLRRLRGEEPWTTEPPTELPQTAQ
jgi:pimeloyl-ACP methyl ester carboxylesterase